MVNMKRSDIWSYFRAGDVIWFRIFGRGLHFTNRPKIFSEREGYRYHIPIGFGWRVGWLGKWKTARYIS